MAIGRMVRPRLIAEGGVIEKRPLKRNADKSVYAYEVLVEQENGARLAVRFITDDTTQVPDVGEYLAAHVTVEESREYGASLSFEEEVSPGDLDRINSALSAPASK